MPGLSPVSRRELVRKLKALGFEGPFPKDRFLEESTSGCVGLDCELRFPIPTEARSIPDSFDESCAKRASR